jgi:hypothetical protein
MINLEELCLVDRKNARSGIFVTGSPDLPYARFRQRH